MICSQSARDLWESRLFTRVPWISVNTLPVTFVYVGKKPVNSGFESHREH
jgi:hypothetical protein